MLFRDLDAAALEGVASRLRAFTLDPGESLAEQPGHLVLVARGRGELLSPSLGGELVATGELSGGDAFGVPALLGEATGSSLRALGAMTLLELDPLAIDAVAAQHPEVQAALERVPAAEGAPTGGKRLGRATFAGRIGDLTGTRASIKATKGPDEADIRRATGTFPRMDV
jgi:CRP-like cAMP-binding protein